MQAQTILDTDASVDSEPLDLELAVLEIGIAEHQRALEEANEQDERAQLRKDLARLIADHKKVAQLIEESRPAYELLTEQDLEELGEDDTPEVIEGLLKEGGSMMIVSPGGIVKSWLGQHIAECRASGKPFLGRYQVREGNALIIDAENLPKEIRKRLRWIRNSLDIEITNRVCILSKPDLLLDNEKNVDALIELVRGIERMTIIVDPLIRFHTGNENSAQDMSRLSRAFNRIQRETQATLIVLQHQTKPGFLAPKGRDAIRGSTELLAWPDVILMADRKDGEYRATVVKNRYGLDGQTIVWDAWISEEDQRADFTFIREDEAEVSRAERVKQLISDLFSEDREWTVREIHQALKKNRVGEKTIREVLKELHDEGQVNYRVGKHRQHFYFNSESSLAEELLMTA